MELEINDKNSLEVQINNEYNHNEIKKIEFDQEEYRLEIQSIIDDLNKINIQKDYFHKGLQLTRLQNYKEAIEMYNQVIRMNPNYFPALNNKGDFRLHQYEEALIYFQETILLQPNNDQGQNNQGIALNIQYRYEEAIESFNQAIFLNPKIGNQSNQSLECYDKAIELNLHSDQAFYFKGSLLTKLDRNVEALEYLSKAIQINPKSDIALTNKGMSRFNLWLTLYNNGLIMVVIKFNQYDSAIQVFDEAIKLNSKNEKAILNKGLALFNLFHYGKAGEQFNKALELNPNYDKAYLNKGIWLYKLFLFDEAIECVNKAYLLHINYNTKNENDKNQTINIMYQYSIILHSYLIKIINKNKKLKIT